MPVPALVEYNPLAAAFEINQYADVYPIQKMNRVL